MGVMVSGQAGGGYMANEGQLRLLRKRVAACNAWRKQTLDFYVDLSRANLSKANLSRADLSGADLQGANLSRANLSRANLRGANLSKANLSVASLGGADLSDANLSRARLSRADLGRAKLIESDISRASLTETDFSGADLTGCRVYGVSAWGLKLSASTKQQGLIITPVDELEITTDDIEVAQFLYLLIRNEKLRKVIDTITSKVVLILGRFSEEAFGAPMRGLSRPCGLAEPPGSSGWPSASWSPYGGSVNQMLPSGCGTRSFGEFSGLPSKESAITVIVPSCSQRTTRRLKSSVES
jgi:hypothetical protein